MKFVTALLLTALAMPSLAQEKRQTPRDAMVAEADAATARAPVEEQAFGSKGSVSIKGKAVAYPPTPGPPPIRDDHPRPPGPPVPTRP